MNKLLRTSWLVLATAIVLAFAISISFAYRRATLVRPPPNPNAYDDYAQAGALLTGRIGDFRDLSQPELDELIATNAPALALVRAGLPKECAVPMQTYLSDFAKATTDLMAQKQIAQLLAAAGRLAEFENRLEDAAWSYVDAIRFGNEISRNGFLINRLVGIACSAIGSASLAKLAPGLACEQAKPIIAELEKLDQTSVTWKEVRHAENVYMRHEIRKRPNPIVWVPEWWRARTMNQKARNKHEKALVRVRLLTAELALRCYRAEQGAPPAQLTQLVPQYLQRVPQDPFSGRSLVYHAQGTNWLLYSVGPDGVDDGGAAAGRGISAKGDLLHDSQW